MFSSTGTSAVPIRRICVTARVFERTTEIRRRIALSLSGGDTETEDPPGSSRRLLRGVPLARNCLECVFAVQLLLIFSRRFSCEGSRPARRASFTASRALRA